MKLDKESVLKIIRGAAIAGGGAASIYALQAIGQFDLGELTAVAVAVSSVLINAIRKALEEYELRD